MSQGNSGRPGRAAWQRAPPVWSRVSPERESPAQAGPDLLGACGPQPAADQRASPTACSPPPTVSRARPSVRTLQGLPVAEEFVVLVVPAKAAADVGEVGDELDLLVPFDLFEAEFELVAQP